MAVAVVLLFMFLAVLTVADLLPAIAEPHRSRPGRAEDAPDRVLPAGGGTRARPPSVS